MAEPGATAALSPIALLKDACLAAAVAFALALPLVGFQTVDTDTAATRVTTRFGWVAIGVAVVFVGRLLLSFALRLPIWRRITSLQPRLRITAVPGGSAIFVAALLVAFAVALPFLPFSSR